MERSCYGRLSTAAGPLHDCRGSESRLTADCRGSSLKESGFSPIMRYLPAPHYLSFGVVAFALAAFSGWLGLGWAPGFIPCALFLLSGAALIYMAYRPAI